MTIEIDIKDDKHYLDVAIVVDRNDFQKEITQIKLDSGITSPMEGEDLNQFIMGLYKQKKATQFDSRIEQARKTLRLPITFFPVIEAAALKNKVSDTDYKPAYLIHDLDVYDDEGYEVGEKYSIVISPSARDSDVLKALQEYRDQLDNEKGVADYKYIGTIWGIEKGKPSIKSYRSWYLAVKSGTSYQQICEQETARCPLVIEGSTHVTGKGKPKDCTCYDESMIRKGVKTYENLIRKTPTF